MNLRDLTKFSPFGSPLDNELLNDILFLILSQIKTFHSCFLDLDEIKKKKIPSGMDTHMTSFYFLNSRS